jgi:hypothetical protein
VTATPGGPSGPRPSPEAPRRTPFAVAVTALFALGLVGQLVLNTALQHGSFNLHTLTTTATSLDEHRQALEQQLASQEEPGTLAAMAKNLGMVASENPVFLRLADGGVTGTPVAATAPPAPPPTTTAPPPTTAPLTTTPPATSAPPAPPPTTSTTP